MADHQRPPGAASRVDPELLGEVGARLAAAADDVRFQGDHLAASAPDPGTPPAPEAVVDVQTSAIDALHALAAALEESSAAVRRAAESYAEAERSATRAMQTPAVRPARGRDAG